MDKLTIEEAAKIIAALGFPLCFYDPVTQRLVDVESITTNGNKIQFNGDGI